MFLPNTGDMRSSGNAARTDHVRFFSLSTRDEWAAEALRRINRQLPSKQSLPFSQARMSFDPLSIGSLE
ncbi:MAG: hypothetical protein O3A46_07685 [Candidatus Poribacteria bacterium]|nr:hypothetical protein [Candidatus Poribacteria bacterium]